MTEEQLELGKFYISKQDVPGPVLTGALSAVKAMLKEGKSGRYIDGLINETEDFINAYSEYLGNPDIHDRSTNLRSTGESVVQFVTENHTAIVAMRSLYKNRICDGRDLAEYTKILAQCYHYTLEIIDFTKPIVEACEDKVKEVMLHYLNGEKRSLVGGVSVINIHGLHETKGFNLRYQEAVNHEKNLRVLIQNINNIKPVEGLSDFEARENERILIIGD